MAVPNSFTASTKAKSAEVNDNFTYVDNQKYVARNPAPTSYDYTTVDYRNYTDWDVSSIVPSNCVAVVVQMTCRENSGTGGKIAVVPNGVSTLHSGVYVQTTVTSQSFYSAGVVAMESDGSTGQTLHLFVEGDTGEAAVDGNVGVVINGWFTKGTT